MNPISIVDERLCLMYIALQIERIYLKCLSLLDTRLTKGRVQMFVASRYATHKKSSSNAWSSKRSFVFFKSSPINTKFNLSPRRGLILWGIVTGDFASLHPRLWSAAPSELRRAGRLSLQNILFINNLSVYIRVHPWFYNHGSVTKKTRRSNLVSS